MTVEMRQGLYLRCPFRSASSVKALADSPVRTGEELIVIAITISFLSAKLRIFFFLRNPPIVKIH